MYYLIYRTQPLMDSNKLKLRLDDISEVNTALTCYHRDDPAPVLPLREEPDLLSWLENTGRLVAEKDGESQEISTIEEEELSALMGEKEDYKTEEDPSLEDDWEDWTPTVPEKPAEQPASTHSTGGLAAAIKKAENTEK